MIDKYFVSYSYMTEKGLAHHNCEIQSNLESLYDVEELERDSGKHESEGFRFI